jgi:hypothetical protein
VRRGVGNATAHWRSILAIPSASRQDLTRASTAFRMACGSDSHKNAISLTSGSVAAANASEFTSPLAWTPVFRRKI